MKRRFLATILGVSLAFCLTGCSCRHEWTSATCTAPKTCSSCGLTEGATLEHPWTEATCAQPKTCTGCGLTEGTKLTHTFGEEEHSKSDYVTATAIYTKTCSGCGIQSHHRNEALETFTDGKTFLMTPEEFTGRLSVMLREMQYILGEDQYFAALYHDTDADTFKLYIAKTDTDGETQIVGEFDLYDPEGNLLLPEQKDDANTLYKVHGTMQNKDSALLAALALWSTGDPADTLKDKALRFAKLNALSFQKMDVHKEINMYSLPWSRDISIKVSSKDASFYELTLKVQ